MKGNMQKKKDTAVIIEVGSQGWNPREFFAMSENERNRISQNLSFDGCSDPQVDCACDCRVDCNKD